MEKLYHFDSPTAVYRADACVITCIDARFDLAVRKFLKRRGIAVYDRIQIPGSAKALAAPDCEPDRDFVLRMIRTSMRLHATDRVLLIGHNDCGAYPGVPPETVARDLLAAAAFLRAAQPDLAVECFFNDFDGVYDVSR
jgi:hypothetical protein